MNIHFNAVAAAALLSFASSPSQNPAPAPRSPHGFTRNVAVLVFDGVELLDFAGPVEAFSQANGFDQPFRIYTVAAERGPLRTNNVVTIVPDFTTRDCPPPDVLVIPGGETAALESSGALASFVREQVPKVEIAMSVCNGAFCLAKGGFLDGLEATTFSSFCPWLREDAPKAKVRDDVRYCDNGHIMTTAGVSAGIDGALHLIDRLLGNAAAAKAARRMEYAWRDAPAQPQPITEPVERARRAWYAGEFEAALDDYRALAAEHPDDAIALGRWGTCLLFTRQHAAAVAPLQRAAQLDSQDWHVHLALGLALSRAGRHADAVAAVSKAHEIDASNREVLHFLGLEQFEVGEYAQALANLRRGLELHVGDDSTVARIAQAQTLLGDLDGALHSLETIADRGDLLTSSFSDARFDALRNDPRFAALVQQVPKK